MGWRPGCNDPAAGPTRLLDRGFRGMVKTREHRHAPVEDRRTSDRLSGAEEAEDALLRI
jgi:hypothetical protein